jgi:3-hydroxyisobutyrate dehydrogenase-like beta-hydroxyacid dehydrogenase
VVGLLHPGEMGSAVGAVLRSRGHEVLWASEGRSDDTARRAAEAALEDAGSVAELARRSDVILSICPPHAALDVAGSVAGFDGIYVDANAISPETSREVAARVPRYVDGGIIGGPPREPGDTRLYLSGEDAPRVAELFEGSALEPVVLSGPVGTASAMKMVYAAWSKGSAALLLAVRATAHAEGVEGALAEEWARSIPGLEERWQRAVRSANKKGWRWVGEMEEIAATFAAAGQPDGFHRAAAEVFRNDR